MAAAAAVRSVTRPAAILRRAVAVADTRSASSLRVPTLRPSITRRFLRCPAQASFCLESMQPLHNTTASALMTSMLSISKSGFEFLSEGTTDIISCLCLSVFFYYHQVSLAVKELSIVTVLLLLSK